VECIMEVNKKYCTCTYGHCARKHHCCQCLHYHRKNGELPACFFTKEYERTYDRSIENFIRMHSSKVP
jgi:hypothetical protein